MFIAAHLCVYVCVCVCVCVVCVSKVWTKWQSGHGEGKDTLIEMGGRKHDKQDEGHRGGNIEKGTAEIKGKKRKPKKIKNEQCRKRGRK